MSNAELLSGEKALWVGQPRQGILLRGADVFFIPFGLLWGGLAFFWEFSVITSGAPFLVVLLGIPFVLIGIYIIIGRFYVDAKQRARTFYAVTNERVLIVSGLFSRKVKSLNLRTLSDLSLSEGKGNEGTISFGGSFPFAGLFGGFSGWPGMGAFLGARFEQISGARAVFEVIRRAQRVAV
jgi:hypothetical protein